MSALGQQRTMRPRSSGIRSYPALAEMCAMREQMLSAGISPKTCGGTGMPGSKEAVAAYRLHAAHCAKIAENTSDPQNRLVLLQMAAAWLTLAEQAKKNSLVYKVLEPLQQQQPGAELSKKQA